jgi:hypothetical protein
MLVWSRRRLIRGSLALTSLSLLAGCGLVSLPGLRPPGPRRIGYLDAGTNSPLVEPVRDGLRELGYVEGQTIAIEYRNAEGKLDRLPALAAELIGVPVELIVTREASSALAASQATSTLPIVVSGGDIVAAGLVANIAHPEGNITGVTTNTAEAIVKWVELLKEAVPTLSRLAAVVDPGAPVTEAVLREMKRAAETLQLHLRSYDLRELDQLPAVLVAVNADRADGLVAAPGGVLGGGTNPPHRRRGAEGASAGGRRDARIRVERRAAGARLQRGRTRQAVRRLCRQAPQRREAGRPADRAADRVRHRRECEVRAGFGDHDPAVDSAAGHRGHPIVAWLIRRRWVGCSGDQD